MILTPIDLTRYLLTAQDLVHSLCVGGGRCWPVLWYAISVSTSRPPSPTRTGLWKFELYHPNLVRNRTLLGPKK
jgi:hypothetical protein